MRLNPDVLNKGRDYMMALLIKLVTLIEQLVKEDNYQMLCLLIVECISSDNNYDRASRQRNRYRMMCIEEAIGEVLLRLSTEDGTRLAEYRRKTLVGIEILERELKL